MSIRVNEFLLVRLNCGDVQAEKGTAPGGGIFSVYSAGAEVRPVNDNQPASPPEADAAPASDQRPKMDAAE